MGAHDTWHTGAMRLRAPILTIAAACVLASCGGGHATTTTATPAAPTAKLITHVERDTTAARLEVALLRNPNQQASAADCHRATAADRRIATASFGGHPRRLYACTVTLASLPAATYDFALTGRCFVGHRRGADMADYGCMR
jgi:hypothetical protein